MYKLTLTVVTHYVEDDPDFSGDYAAMEILAEDTFTGQLKVIAEFGDAYHESSHTKVEGFIQGVQWTLDNRVELAFLPELVVNYKNVADWEG